MRDSDDTKLRELAYRLAQMAPDAPPFPEEPMVQLRPSPTRQPTPPRRRTPFVLAGVAAVVVLLVVGGPLLFDRLTSDQTPGPATTLPPTTLPPTTATAPPTTEPTATTAVPEPAVPTNVTVYFVDEAGHLVPLGRVVDAAPTTHDRVAAALTALFEGPTSDDEALVAGIRTAIPGGVTLPGLTTDQTGTPGTVEVVVNDAFGTADWSAAAQVVYTVTQFPDIETVTLVTEDGSPVVLADGTVLGAPLNRADFFGNGERRDVLAPVFIDSPSMNGVVASPFTLTGIANVTEGQVGYEVVLEGFFPDGKSPLLAEGILVAGPPSDTCGTACWAGFSVDVSYELPQVEVGWVYVFSIAPDGSRTDVVRHLVTIEASPGDGQTVPPDAGRVVEVDVAGLPLVEAAPTPVVSAGWGSAPGQLGRLEPQDFGPCCFDVAPDGTVVVSDTQNQRIVVYHAPDDLFVLATFDPADFVPGTLATDGNLVYALGFTNRPGRPYDLIVLDLASGDQVSRTETSLDINADLRVTTSGVFAGLGGAEPQWIQLAGSDGVPIPAEQQVALAELPSETSIATTFDGSSVSIAVRPAGDSPTTTYRIPIDGMTVDILSIPGAPDANGIAVWMTADLSGAQPSTVTVLGTDAGALVGSRFDVTIPRTVVVGPFNAFRYAFGGLYLMTTNENGVEILRYELP
jgi:hypothetical protein